MVGLYQTFDPEKRTVQYCMKFNSGLRFLRLEYEKYMRLLDI